METAYQYLFPKSFFQFVDSKYNTIYLYLGYKNGHLSVPTLYYCKADEVDKDAKVRIVQAKISLEFPIDD